MKRQHYLVTCERASALMREHQLLVDDANDSRTAFAQKYRADGFKLFQRLTLDGGVPQIVSVTGLRFRDAVPPGFVRSSFHPEYAVPDVRCARGRELVTAMAALPPVPVPHALAALIGCGGAIKVRPDGGACTLVAESLDGADVLSVPVFSEDEVQLSPSLAWNGPAKEGFVLLSDADYREMRELARQHSELRRALARP